MALGIKMQVNLAEVDEEELRAYCSTAMEKVGAFVIHLMV